MVKKVNNNMKKLLFLAALAIGIGQTACAHPHSYYRPYPRQVAYPVSYYGYDYSPCYNMVPVYYNNWNGCNNWNYRRPYCGPPVISYGFSFNNGRSFGRVNFR